MCSKFHLGDNLCLFLLFSIFCIFIIGWWGIGFNTNIFKSKASHQREEAHGANRPQAFSWTPVWCGSDAADTMTTRLLCLSRPSRSRPAWLWLLEALFCYRPTDSCPYGSRRMCSAWLSAAPDGKGCDIRISPAARLGSPGLHPAILAAWSGAGGLRERERLRRLWPR